MGVHPCYTRAAAALLVAGKEWEEVGKFPELWLDVRLPISFFPSLGTDEKLGLAEPPRRHRLKAYLLHPPFRRNPLPHPRSPPHYPPLFPHRLRPFLHPSVRDCRVDER
jgi:hypothetical protein